MRWFQWRYRTAILVGALLAVFALYAMFVGSVAKNEIIFGVSQSTATIISIVGFILTLLGVAVALVLVAVKAGERNE